jgi:hypothetical protein
MNLPTKTLSDFWKEITEARPPKDLASDEVIATPQTSNTEKSKK